MSQTFEATLARVLRASFDPQVSRLRRAFAAVLSASVIEAPPVGLDALACRLRQDSILADMVARGWEA